MLRSEQRELQRLRYRQGQMLRSRDFRDRQGIEAQLRAWHNRALHNTYGVARDVLEGLKVEQIADPPGIIVKSGLAYDCFGHKLMLIHSQSIPVPESGVSILLAIRCKDLRACQPPSEAPGACFPVKTSAGAKDIDFVWITEDKFAVRDGVALARVDEAGELDDSFVVRQSRPLARPRIASGATIPGATTWEVWDLKQTKIADDIGSLQVRIDTSSVGFTRAPAYFAQLQGPVIFQDKQSKELAISLHLDHIDEASVNGFVFRFFIAFLKITTDGELRPETDLRGFLQQQNAYVSWLGVEPKENDEADS